MNFQPSYEYPTRPGDFINRSAETASRLGGVLAFGVCLLGLVYLLAN